MLSLGVKFRSNLFLRISSMLLITTVKAIAECLSSSRQYGKCFTLSSLILTKLHEVMTIIFFTLHIKKLRLNEVK